MGTSCRTDGKPPSTGAPTRWVGESSVTSSGLRCLELDELPEQQVVRAVAHGRGVQDVVAMVRVVELGAQLGGAGGGIGGGHRHRF